MSWNVIEVRRDITPMVLRRKARREKDGRVAGRIFAIANVLDGMPRDLAAQSGGMTRQILRDWIIRYNAEGLAGLYDRTKGHTRSVLTVDQLEELRILVLHGPDDNRVRWRLVDLKAEIERRFGVVYHERSVGKILRRLGFVRLSVRPVHPEAGLEAQADFKKTSEKTRRLFCPSTPGRSLLKSGFKTKHASDRQEPSPGFGACVVPALA